MFTGIIEDLATVAVVEPLEAGRRLTIRSRLPVVELAIGESITIDGACMTVTATTDDGFAVEVSAESLRRTTLGDLAVGDAVNLERSVRMNDRLGGHLVSGHIDGTGVISDVRAEGESAIYTFEVGTDLAAPLVEKGSVAVDGISLTCYECTESAFCVAVIPHTADVTTLGRKSVGARVNVENDLIGKYVAKLLAPHLDRRKKG